MFAGVARVIDGQPCRLGRPFGELVVARGAGIVGTFVGEAALAFDDWCWDRPALREFATVFAFEMAPPRVVCGYVTSMRCATGPVSYFVSMVVGFCGD